MNASHTMVKGCISGVKEFEWAFVKSAIRDNGPTYLCPVLKSLTINTRHAPWLLALIGALAYLPGLGAVPLFDWDEANFATIAYNMLLTGDYLQPRVAFTIFTEKPPLFFWLQAAMMQLFGQGEFAARLPNALCGILTLPLLYRIGMRHAGPIMAWWWPLLYLCSTLPFLYFKSGIIDPVFNLFIILQFYALHEAAWYNREGRTRRTVALTLAAGMMAGLALLTKGPAVWIITGMAVAVLMVANRFRWVLRPEYLALYVLTGAAMAGLWATADIWLHGPQFMADFFYRQVALFTTPDAGHGGFPGYHIVVLLLGCFPASVLALWGWRAKHTHPKQVQLHRWMLVLLIVVVVLFSIVQSKIIHYSSLAYFPLTFLGATYLSRHSAAGRKLPGGLVAFLLAIGMVYLLASVALPWLGQNPQLLERFAKNDPVFLASLTTPVSWPWYTWLPAVVMAISLTVVLWCNARGRFRQTAIALLGGHLLWLVAAMTVFTGRIAYYAQGPAVDWLKEMRGQEVHVHTIGWRSYLQWYYPQHKEADIYTDAFRNYVASQQSEGNPQPRHFNDFRQMYRNFLLTGIHDRPVYFISRAGKEGGILERYTQFVLVERKGGYVLLRSK